MKKMLKYPATILFFLFLIAYTLFDMTFSKQAYSELENRPLTQKPSFSFKALFSNEYTPKYEEYVNDQFVLRDNWISLKSRCEYSIGKIENNGIVYGNDHYQFVKMFSVNEEQYRKNVNTINLFAAQYPGLVTTIIVPSAYVPLADKIPAEAPFIDENKCLDEIYEQLRASTTIIDLRPVFEAHNEDYIYYRTDHHWTTFGAYLAYNEYAALKGFTSFVPGDFTEVDVEGFYGTNFSKSKLFNTVPDILTYYDLPNELTIEGATTGLYDFEKLYTRDKYAMFLYGNNGFSRIGSGGDRKCLIIKDSYGNCFTPFLTANYSQIDVVDLRTMTQSVNELIAVENYDDIIILYNFQTFQSDNYLTRLILDLP